MIPVFAPLKQQINFSQHQIAEELIQNEIDKHSVLATTTFEDGQSRWKGVMSFEDDKFSKTKDVIHYEDNGNSKEIVKDLRKFVNESRISREDAWYNILYYIPLLYSVFRSFSNQISRDYFSNIHT